MLKFARKLIGTMLAFCAIAQAGAINIGLISFDLFISGTPQVDVFNISNFTGDLSMGGFALPPDFPVFTALTFRLSSLTLVDLSGTQIIPLGHLLNDPGKH